MLPEKIFKSNTIIPPSGTLTSSSLRGLVGLLEGDLDIIEESSGSSASSFFPFAISLSSSLFSYYDSSTSFQNEELGVWTWSEKLRILRLNFLNLAESSMRLYWMRLSVWNEYLLALWRILEGNAASKFVALGLIEAPSLLFAESREGPLTGTALLEILGISVTFPTRFGQKEHHGACEPFQCPLLLVPLQLLI